MYNQTAGILFLHEHHYGSSLGLSLPNKKGNYFIGI
jgi:hypothetical protein